MKKFLLGWLFALLFLPLFSTEPLVIPEDAFRMKSVAGDPNDTIEIDIMIAYTSAAKVWASTRGGILKRIEDGMAVSQLALDNSLSGIKLRLVHTMEVGYQESGNSETDLRRLTFGYSGVSEWQDTIRWLGEAREARDSFGADLVILVPATGTAAGMAWQLRDDGGRPDYGYSIVTVHYINQLTKVHELGHNMGAHHHAAQKTAPGPGIWPYSAGWRWAGTDSKMYVSAMSYPSGSYYPDGLSASRVSIFSSPLLFWMGGRTGDPEVADNARTLREIKHTIAAYRERKDPPDTLSVSILDLYDITWNSAKVVVVSNKEAERGILFGPWPDPDFSEKREGDSLFLEGLEEDRQYYLRAYAIHLGDTAVSPQMDFLTLLRTPPQISTIPPYNITTRGFASGVVLISDGHSPVIEVGICWGEHEDLWIGDKCASGWTVTVYTLSPGKQYWVRAYAKNEIGYGYGESIPFNTKEDTVDIPPILNERVKLWPNPSTGVINVSYNSNYRVMIINSTGSIVLYSNPVRGTTSWTLRKGTYYFIMETTNKKSIIYREKVVIL